MTATFLVPAIQGLYVEDSSTVEFAKDSTVEVVSVQQYSPVTDSTYYGLVVRTDNGDVFTVVEEREVRFNE